MSYSTGFLDHRVTIANRRKAATGDYGIDGAGIDYRPVATVWANVDWSKGKTAMNSGALDSYAVIMVRMRWNDKVGERSRIIHEGSTYQVIAETFHADRRKNTIQFLAQRLVDGGGGE